MKIKNIVGAIFVILICVILFTVLYVSNNDTYEEHIIIHVEGHVRSPQDRFSFPVEGENNIIFIESGCVVEVTENDEKNFRLNKRQACSIESAAKNNPGANVFLMYTCPVTPLVLASAATHVHAIFSYPNVFLWPVNSSQFFSGTPLDEWYHGGALKKSKWPVVHGSDVLRLLVLWKVGGVYLDLDVIVLKSFNKLPGNFIAIEEPSLGNSVIAIDSSETGRTLSQMCVEEIRTNYLGHIWAHNGPQLLDRVMKKLCATTNLKQTTPESCHGITILPSKSFYPLSFGYYNNYFDDKNTNSTMNALKDSYAVHLWNIISGRRDISTEIRSPYVLMATENCPRIFREFDKILHVVHSITVS